MTAIIRSAVVVILAVAAAGCATITEDPMDRIAVSFSDGSVGSCHFSNKRGGWDCEMPGIVSVRKSDDVLKYDCQTKDGRKATGAFESRIGAKIVASAVFIDLGITDAITDKHREYPGSFVIPILPRQGESSSVPSASSSEPGNNDLYMRLEKLDDLRMRGILTDEEFEAEKKKLLEKN